ncbi:MAG: DUF58 domain-containing protein [Myxococcota bacterium]|nr:DUF58 domain-containing protein [Myxococcota bacterium]
MQLHPTRATLHIATAGAALIALGAAARLAPVVAFGGAMLLAVALGRAIALVSVTNLRDAGFEMVWAGATRVHRVARGSSVELGAELRNRSGETVRCVGVRPIGSSMFDVEVHPTGIDLPPGGRASLAVRVHAKRIGRWGMHGLALEVRGTHLGGDGLYEVPLLFASPLGIEVVPRCIAVLSDSPRGGRARRASEMGRPAAFAGEGDELRELREHAPGDPFRRIAWKASARRGRLLVREMERDDRDVVWLVVDASVELLAGMPGTAPLDRVVEAVADRATQCLRRGDRVGLVVVASRVRAWIAPDRGPAQGAAIAAALGSATSCVDADRSDLDESEVARRVSEHARPLDPQGLADLRRGDLDALARRAEQLRARAPFAAPPAFADTTREQALRGYLAAFGIESPPRSEGERDRTEATLARVLEKLATQRPRPSVLHVWGLPPTRPQTTAKAIATLRRRRTELRWSVPPLDAGVGSDRQRRSAVADVVDDAVRARARAMATRGERLLRRLGVHVVAFGIVRPPPRAEVSNTAGERA